MGAYSNLGIFQDALTEIDASGLSENMIDLGVTVPKIGVGQHAPYLCIRSVTPSTTAADTLSIELQCSATQSGSDLSGTIKTVSMVFSDAVGAQVRADDAELAAGAWLYRGQLPYGVDLRYVQLYFNNSATTGHFHLDAWLSDTPASDFRGSQVIKSDVGQP